MIPFETELSGKRNSAKKILYLLYQSSAWWDVKLFWWAKSAKRAGSDIFWTSAERPGYSVLLWWLWYGRLFHCYGQAGSCPQRVDQHGAKKTSCKKAGNYSDALFFEYDRERNRWLPEIGAEYHTLS